MAFELHSPAFTHGHDIPSLYTCDGADVSPPLSWSGFPESTRSFVIIVDDPDAPDPRAPRMTWVHWLLYNIPAQVRELKERASAAETRIGMEGLNDWKRTGYGGPCPPIGKHRYFHKIYALDSVLADLGNPTKNELLSAMKGHVLAEAVLIGTYQKRH